MQTFLPYPNFACSVMTLDTRRLGKQRLECSQIYWCSADEMNSAKFMAAVTEEQLGRRMEPVPGWSKGWRNHPAVAMWRNNRPALALYYSMVVWEWERRGFFNSMRTPYDRDFKPNLDYDPTLPTVDEIVLPSWLGDERFHASHRSNLLRKESKWYGQFGWTEPPDLPYVWPQGVAA